VADDTKIEVLERISDRISVYTVLINDKVYLITKNKELITKFIKKKNG
jgi:hypothetical protein